MKAFKIGAIVTAAVVAVGAFAVILLRKNNSN